MRFMTYNMFRNNMRRQNLKTRRQNIFMPSRFYFFMANDFREKFNDTFVLFYVDFDVQICNITRRNVLIECVFPNVDLMIY